VKSLFTLRPSIWVGMSMRRVSCTASGMRAGSATHSARWSGFCHSRWSSAENTFGKVSVPPITSMFRCTATPMSSTGSPASGVSCSLASTEPSGAPWLRISFERRNRYVASSFAASTPRPVLPRRPGSRSK